MLHPVETGRKLNVPKTSWTPSECLMYVQFTSCVYWVRMAALKLERFQEKAYVEVLFKKGYPANLLKQGSTADNFLGNV